MFDFQEPAPKAPVPAPKAPPCPLCGGEMALKKIHRLQPDDHFIFRCAACNLEYPVVGGRCER